MNTPSFTNWISAFRLRTLFLAVAGVILGSGLALHVGHFSARTFALALALAVSIQILSNLANDLGDYLKGTDTSGKRQGPARALQSGNISPRQMRVAIAVNLCLVAVIGLTLVLSSLHGTGQHSTVLILLGIGLVSMLAALCYTLGRHAYGYSGWGDFFAFLFFGPVAVVGTYFLQTNSFNVQPLLPATGLGLISTMILNVNNMRDINNDRLSGKVTVASRLGLGNAKLYHTLLTFGMFACFLQYSLLFDYSSWYKLLYVVVFILMFYILIQIRKRSDRELDPYLKYTSMAGFLLSVLFSVCINI